jgi:3-hydroxyacyl-CoA dehydrogenase
MQNTTATATARQPVAVIGAGLIGRAWAIVFARAGHPVRLHDMDLPTMQNSHAYIEERLNELAEFDLLKDTPKAVLERITCVPDLAEALRDVVLVQENVRETVEAKTAIFRQLDELAPKNAILASSTSWIPASEFTADVPGRERCLVAHPTNPPYLIPLVELCPAPWTASDVMQRAHDIYAGAGQSPVALTREIPGFLLNRVQAAVLNECFKLHRDGLANSEDIDRVLKDGLALRWSFMGPFETIDLNAPAGVLDYAKRYGQQIRETVGSEDAFDWAERDVAKVNDERRQKLEIEGIALRSAWRDRRLMALAAHKRQAPNS